jgi:ribose-phosphate pyrophosphokinase
VTVIATSSSLGLAAKLSRLLSRELLVAEEKVFPDGEKYLRIPKRLEGDVLLVHSLHQPQDERFVQLLLAVDAAKGAGASRVIVVVPYFAYARQDKRFLEGEPVSVGALLKAVEAAGADALAVVDIHKPSSLDEWLKIPHFNVLPVGELAGYFRGKLRDPVVLAPDKGALHRAQLAAQALGAEYDYLEKSRDRVTGEVKIAPKSVDVGGRDVLFIDDIISTGSTLVAAAKEVLALGAKRVYAACTHALLVSGALDKLYAAGVEEVVATDTVPSPVSRVSVAEPIAEAVRKLLR